MSEPAQTYVRRTIDRCADASRRSGEDHTVWQLVHLLGIVMSLDVAGHGDAIRKAADEQARLYGLAPQSDVADAPARLTERMNPAGSAQG
jgi:hypothetical protein